MAGVVRDVGTRDGGSLEELNILLLLEMSVLESVVQYHEAADVDYPRPVFSLESPLPSLELLGTFDDIGSSVSLHAGTLLFLSIYIKIERTSKGRVHH